MSLLAKSMWACGMLALGLASTSHAAVTVGSDLSTGWQGYMNVSELPQNGGGYVFGSGWGIPDLQAVVNGPVVTLGPEISLDRDVPTDTFWWQDASGTSPGNKIMDANYYFESDALAGETITFTAEVLSNTFAAPFAPVAFIKDFSPGYAVVGSVTVPLTPGVFSITLATTPGDHIQYGFETIGPDVRVADAAAVGSAQVQPVVVPEPAAAAVVMPGLALLVRRRR